MVKKKDGSWRMCVDYRRVNKTSRFDCFPLPRLDEAQRVRRRRFLFLARPGDGLSPGARCPLLHREDRVHHTRGPVRNPQDAVWPLQRAAHVPAPDVDCAAWPHRAHLPRLLRRRDRLLASTPTAPRRLARGVRTLARRWPKVETLQLYPYEILYLGHVINKSGIAPTPRSFAY